MEVDQEAERKWMNSQTEAGTQEEHKKVDDESVEEGHKVLVVDTIVAVGTHSVQPGKEVVAVEVESEARWDRRRWSEGTYS